VETDDLECRSSHRQATDNENGNLTPNVAGWPLVEVSPELNESCEKKPPRMYCTIFFVATNQSIVNKQRGHRARHRRRRFSLALPDDGEKRSTLSLSPVRAGCFFVCGYELQLASHGWWLVGNPSAKPRNGEHSILSFSLVQRSCAAVASSIYSKHIHTRPHSNTFGFAT